MKTIIILIILSFLIYSYFFCNLGNTCLRLNSNGEKIFSIIPLLTEGFIGPIRSLLNLIFKGKIIGAYKYFIFESNNLANPFFTFLIIYKIYQILKFNKIIFKN